MRRGVAGVTEQRFILTTVPPSSNHLFATVGKYRVKSREYRAWRDSAQWQLKIQFPKLTDKPVCVEYAMRRPGPTSDVENRIKPLSDSLTGIVLKDDSQIVDLRIRWADVDGVHITVRTA